MSEGESPESIETSPYTFCPLKLVYKETITRGWDREYLTDYVRTQPGKYHNIFNIFIDNKIC